LISAIAVPGARPLGQVREQFRILPSMLCCGEENTCDICRGPWSFEALLFVRRLLGRGNRPAIGKLASTRPVQAIITISHYPQQQKRSSQGVRGCGDVRIPRCSTSMMDKTSNNMRKGYIHTIHPIFVDPLYSARFPFLRGTSRVGGTV